MSFALFTINIIRNRMCNYLKYQNHIRFIGVRKVNVKNPENEAKLPIFQYPVSKSSDRRVYVWGYFDTGALGVSVKKNKHTKSVVKTPKRLYFGEQYDVVDVACGFGYTLFVVKAKEGECQLYGTGVNTDSQIGYHPCGSNKSLELVMYPQPIQLPGGNGYKVLKVSAGRAHVLVLTTDGLFTFGNNAYGQCGRHIVEDEKYTGNSIIHHIENINGENIIDVLCGQDHSLLLTENGKVYSCGWGADGQTGLAHYNIETNFRQVLGDIKGEVIQKVACTVDCVLALNDKGQVFGWGNSEYGQLLARNDLQQISTPIYLEQCRGIGSVVDIASGGSHCMALNEEGHLFVWGYGLLGKGPALDHSYEPTPIAPILFGKNEFQPDTKVVSIACGVGHSGVITNTGDLYIWGKNRNGCLGLGHENNQYFPFKVCIGAIVTKFACSLDHTVVICKPFI